MADVPGGAKTEVDITSLESAVAWLEGLEQFVKTKLIQEPAGKLNISERSGAQHKPDGGGAGTQAQRIFGGFPGAQDAAMAYSQLYAQSLTAYQGLQEALGQTVDGTRRIIANYRTVEERNHASMADITRLLSSDSPTSAGPAATATVNTASPAPATASGATANPPSDEGSYGG